MLKYISFVSSNFRDRMTGRIVVIFFYFFILSKFSFACQCPITKLNEAETNKYEIIFKGKIVSVNLKEQGNSEAVFLVDELYKGNSAERFTILFDNTNPCKIDLKVGEEWLIYSNYVQINKAKLDFCSRSRKYIKNIKEDFFEVTTGMSYDEELHYLQAKLGLHKLLKDNPNKVENRNKIPSKNQFVMILLCSLVGIVVFYWLIRKILK